MRGRSPALVPWLVLLWILLWGNVSIANLVSGVVVSSLIVIGSGPERIGSTSSQDRARISPWHFVMFLGFVAVQLVRSNAVLAREILSTKSRINLGVIAVELRTDSELMMLIVANVITMTPGTITLEVVGSPATLYVNVLHSHDVTLVRRSLLRIEEFAVRAFGSRRTRTQLHTAMVPKASGT